MSIEEDMDGMRAHARRVLVGPNSFIPVLAWMLLLTGSTALVSASSVLRVLNAFLAVGLVLLVTRRAFRRARWARTVNITAAVAGAGTIVAALVGAEDGRWQAIASALFATILVLALLAVTRHALMMRTVDVNTVAAAVTAYLLVGLVFATVYGFAGTVQEGFFATVAEPETSDYTYFSFITLTTVGYGDLTPGTNLARSIAVMEAIIGQIFLVTIVARVVAMMGTQRQLPTPPNNTDADRDVGPTR